MDHLLTFLDFTSESNYLRLQNHFAQHDTRAVPNENTFSAVMKADFTIIYKEVDVVTGDDDYIDISFYKNFLIPKLENLANRYIHALSRRLENPELLPREGIKLFSQNEQHKLNSLNLNIEKTDYLDGNIKDLVSKQLDIASEFLSNVHIHPNAELNKLFKFKMNRDTVILLFSMLRDKRFIDAPYDNIFGRLLDENFVYWDENSESYKPFNNSGKVINNFKNSNKPCAKSISKLKSIFSSDFFLYPYE